ncbi:uncharacterized protein LOC125940698 [Dermacentor silvarum]|uniref:uncharacterized protein LOC125940698 n=1 Tax=Dermacentor silvarum TaxID=543639 RepID=UPI002100B591|nr:uncharacterized protein LOC125940698 [Dermacentor silvarum]
MVPWFFNVVAALCCLFVGTVTACGGHSSIRCSPELAYHCYHDLSMKFVIDPLIPASPDSHEFFVSFCATAKEFPLHCQCKFFYSGCFESEKRQFRLHEQGYDFLQFMSTKLDICISPAFLHGCVDFSILRKCGLERPHAAQPLREFRKQSYALVEEFTACINRALEKCDNATDAANLDVVKLMLTATSNLNWFDEDAEPEVTTPVATTTKSTEAPSTTEYTEPSTEATTARATTPEATTVKTTPRDQTSTSAATTMEAFTATAHTPDATKAPYNTASTTNALGALVLVALGLLKI